MKKTMIISFAVLFASLLFTNCEEEEMDVPINFEFRLLDKLGNPSTEFEEGENFVFSFIIINHSNKKVFFEHNMSTEDFLRVYRVENSEESGDFLNLGKPYDGIFCEYKSGSFIEAKDSLKLQIPWKPTIPWQPGTLNFSPFFCEVNSDNSLLNKGAYETKFSSSFNFSVGSDHFILEETFKIKFTVK